MAHEGWALRLLIGDKGGKVTDVSSDGQRFRVSPPLKGFQHAEALHQRPGQSLRGTWRARPTVYDNNQRARGAITADI
jgi:hypothetical protein